MYDTHKITTGMDIHLLIISVSFIESEFEFEFELGSEFEFEVEFEFEFNLSLGLSVSFSLSSKHAKLCEYTWNLIFYLITTSFECGKV